MPFTYESTSCGIRNGGHLGFSAAILLAHLGHLGPLMFWTQNILKYLSEISAFCIFFPALSKVEPNAPGLYCVRQPLHIFSASLKMCAFFHV